MSKVQSEAVIRRTVNTVASEMTGTIDF